MVAVVIQCPPGLLTMTTTMHSSRNGREEQLPIHPPSPQHKRRWQAESHVRPDEDQGCRTSLLESGVQEGRC